MFSYSEKTEESVQRLIDNLDREHPVFEQIDWNTSSEELRKQVAEATRNGVYSDRISPVPEAMPIHYGREGETPQEAILRCLKGTWITAAPAAPAAAS